MLARIVSSILSITRPKGRVRIETPFLRCGGIPITASPGRKAGCGLKRPRSQVGLRYQTGITRPKGRVRIETSGGTASRPTTCASPGRKAGCGLKLQV